MFLLLLAAVVTVLSATAFWLLSSRGLGEQERLWIESFKLALAFEPSTPAEGLSAAFFDDVIPILLRHPQRKARFFDHAAPSEPSAVDAVPHSRFLTFSSDGGEETLLSLVLEELMALRELTAWQKALLTTDGPVDDPRISEAELLKCSLAVAAVNLGSFALTARCQLSELELDERNRLQVAAETARDFAKELGCLQVGLPAEDDPNLEASPDEVQLVKADSHSEGPGAERRQHVHSLWLRDDSDPPRVPARRAVVVVAPAAVKAVHEWSRRDQTLAIVLALWAATTLLLLANLAWQFFAHGRVLS